MEYNRLKTAVMDIRMPEGMQTRILNHALVQSRRRFPHHAGFWRSPAAVLIEAALCMTIAVPVLAASSDTVHNLMYQISPSVAQFFQPVRQSDESNGIRMEVISAHLDGDTADLYITMQDLIGDRIDKTTDLYDSYTIDIPFDTSSHCEQVGYDAETGIVTFLVSITRTDGHPIDGGKITFAATEFLSRKSVYDGIEIPLDLNMIETAPETQHVRFTGASGMGAKYAQHKERMFEALVPGKPDKRFPVDGIDLTGMGFVDGQLHIQTSVMDPLGKDNHGYFYFVDGNGSQICYDASYTFQVETSDGRTDYTDYLFNITPEQLATCKLYGNFWTSSLLTQGDWKVTFDLGADVPE